MSGSPQDQRHYQPHSLDDLTREFPQWESWQGINNRFYARLLKSSPPVVKSALDLVSLRDEIIGWAWRGREVTTEENGSDPLDEVTGTLDGVFSDLTYARARLAVRGDRQVTAQVLERLASELTDAASKLREIPSG